MVSKRFLQVAVFGLGVLGLTGCDFSQQLKREWRALLIIARGGVSPLAEKRSPIPSPSPAGYEYGKAARTSQMHRELFTELYQTVFLRVPPGEEFSGYVNILNQGASLEGVYNGLVHSSDYRGLEVQGAQATPECLKIFVRLLEEFEGQLPEVTFFDASAANPLPVLSPDHLANPPENPATAGNRPSYAELFKKSSFFTLKRVLGDEALKVLAAKGRDPQKVAAWYAPWATRLAAEKVDFGLEPRNRADERFHYIWVMQTSEENVKWEVLNRVHRLLNQAQNSGRSP